MKECLRCNKMIPDNTIRDYCEVCYEVYEKIFDKIREYLRENPLATAFEVAEYTGVDHQIIKKFVKEGRLIEIEAESVNIECKRCGALILSKYHEYCPKCEKTLFKEFNGLKGHFVQLENAKMHHKKLSRK
ncbi:hypothetical protein R9X47_12860 [Wukongibacter baidiensis]|uniref:hypothetical protein n=1 Tax=Wukongibacter baidiensis TaxID=1723361 RepID=UPI003D7FF040